jgi:O-glycosyl hydrolase
VKEFIQPSEFDVYVSAASARTFLRHLESNVSSYIIHLYNTYMVVQKQKQLSYSKSGEELIFMEQYSVGSSCNSVDRICLSTAPPLE